MKNYLLGVLTVLALNFGLNLAAYVGQDSENKTLQDVGFKGGEFLKGTDLVHPLTNRCGNERNIKWFQCDPVQVKLNSIIYGDHK